MPQIIGQVEQQKAMRDIKSALKKMEVTNQFLEMSNPSGQYTVSFKDHNGNHRTTTIYAPEKHLLDDLAIAYKRQVVEDMMRRAQENRIELDPEERKIFGV